jgi:hypothetical protein
MGGSHDCLYSYRPPPRPSPDGFILQLCGVAHYGLQRPVPSQLQGFILHKGLHNRGGGSTQCCCLMFNFIKISFIISSASYCLSGQQRHCDNCKQVLVFPKCSK